VAMVQGLLAIKKTIDGNLDHSSRLGCSVVVAVIGMVLLIELLAAKRELGARLGPAMVRNFQGRVTRYQLFYYDASWKGLESAVDWLRNEGTPGSVAASSCPHDVYLWAHLKCVMPPMEADPAKEQQLLDSAQVSYLIVDHLDFIDICRRYVEPVVEKFPELWQLVFTTADKSTRIYHRTESLRATP
jgi:hypothetical protein